MAAGAAAVTPRTRGRVDVRSLQDRVVVTSVVDARAKTLPYAARPTQSPSGSREMAAASGAFWRRSDEQFRKLGDNGQGQGPAGRWRRCRCRARLERRRPRTPLSSGFAAAPRPPWRWPC